MMIGIGIGIIKDDYVLLKDPYKRKKESNIKYGWS